MRGAISLSSSSYQPYHKHHTPVTNDIIFPYWCKHTQNNAVFKAHFTSVYAIGSKAKPTVVATEQMLAQWHV